MEACRDAEDRVGRSVPLHGASDLVGKVAVEAMDAGVGYMEGTVGTALAVVEDMGVVSPVQELSLKVSSCAMRGGPAEGAWEKYRGEQEVSAHCGLVRRPAAQ
jgi:hypothetical protein